MIIAQIITEIQEHIRINDGESDYNDWAVVLSWKDENQFLIDTPYYKQKVKKIDSIDMNTYDELLYAVEAAGLKIKEEVNPTTIYICKLSH